MQKRRPTLLIAHHRSLDLFDTPALERIAEVADILDTEPVDDWSEPRSIDLLDRAEVILGHWGCPPVNAALLDGAPNLGLFVYAAGTVKHTLDPDVFSREIRVTSGALANAEPVAEFTVATILFSNKDVFWQRDVLRTPRDPELETFRQPHDVAVGNYDKTIGIVGASLIGRRVIELLRPFPHLGVVVYDPFLSEDEATELGVTKMDLDDLCRASDIVSIHAPDLPATHHMIGAAQLAAMRTGATLVNTARGRLLDHDALLAETSSGRLSAVLDVTDPEPLPREHPLWALPNVFITPHLAGSLGTELRRMVDAAIDEIDRWRNGRPGRNEVTAAQLDRLA
ncbi:MAG: hydroxyacid dehydrogenase [Ilumatobacteraceae bacterium]